jgi:hypothetical protein
VAVQLTPAGTVTLAGQVMLGGAPSTLTTNELEAMLPYESVAVQTTGVDPMGKTLPLAGTQVTCTVPSTMSVAVGLI